MSLKQAYDLVPHLRDMLVEGGKIHFFGTEPMLSFPVMAGIITWLEDKMDKSYRLGVTTNGSLINQYKAEFLKEHNVGVLLSCDGIAEAHDLHRVSINGSSTHEDVIRGWDWLLTSGIVPSIAATVTPDTVKYLVESANFLLGRSQQFVHFNLDTTHSGKWSTWELHKYWQKLALWYVKRGHKMGKIGNFDKAKEAYKNYKGKSNQRSTCGACQKSIGIDVDGSIKPCHRSNLEPVGMVKKETVSIDMDKFLNIRNYDFNQCKSCPAYPCSTCYANFQDATGDMYAMNPEWCKVQLVKWQVNELLFRNVPLYAKIRD